MDDLDTLLAGCRGGDPASWEALVRKFQGRVYGFALHYVRDREEARDVAQEIFVKVYEHVGGLRDGRTFLPWLLRLTRNRCIDRIRGREAVAHPGGPGATPAERASDAATPEDTLLAGARSSLLYRVIATLSAVNREIVLLKDIEELSLPVISHRLGLPLGTVKSRSNRARSELAKAVRTLTAVP